jgi:hypothetical protein
LVLASLFLAHLDNPRLDGGEATVEHRDEDGDLGLVAHGAGAVALRGR